MPIPILMPALSPTMETGTLARWLVKEGDQIKAGDVIAEIETDKANMEVEAADDGRLGKILVAAGSENIAINTPIALLLGEGEEMSAADTERSAAKTSPKKKESFQGKEITKETAKETTKETAKETSVTQKPPVVPTRQSKVAEILVQTLAAATSQPSPTPRNGARLHASPLARRVAKARNVDLANISGSGPHGRIIKRDVETAPAMRGTTSAPMSTAPAEPGVDVRAYFAQDSYVLEPLTSMRRAVAKRLAQSMRERPHYYLTIDCQIDKLLELRAELNERAQTAEVPYKLSVNDFVVRAAALALMKVPQVNVTYTEEGMFMHKHADISVAVALEAGLITPIVREADVKGLAVISNEIKDMAARAASRKLKPSEYEGGTFSVSNLGMFGIKHFTAVINPPHSAILSVGAGEKRPVVRDGRITPATVMTCTLSCDHRAIDGAVGAHFCQAFKALIEEPLDMLL